MAGSRTMPIRIPRAWWRVPAIAPAGVALGIVAVAAYRLVALAQSAFGERFAGGDLRGYLAGATRFLETGSPYPAYYVTGPWNLGPDTFIHPPAALPLFLPFLVLPAFLWWAIPIAIVAAVVVRFRPAPWTWPLMALCLVWPRTAGSLVAGNTDMWAAAIVALGVRFSWPFVLLLIKPTYLPIAVLGIRSRAFWVASAIGVVAVLATLPAWLQWLTVIRNGSLGIDYSLLNVPLVVLPAIAWAGRRKTSGAPEANSAAASDRVESA